jgi:hypothetical protein
MTERLKTPQQKQQAGFVATTKPKHQQRTKREEEAAALERIREECRRWKRLQRREMRRAAR